MPRRSNYQECVSRDLETTVLRLASNMPGLIDDLRDVRPNYRRDIVRQWMRENSAYAEVILEGIAVFVGELQNLARNRVGGLL